VSRTKYWLDVAMALMIVIGAGLLSWRTGSVSIRAFHEVQLEPGDIPVGIAPSPDGSVWFTLDASDRLGIFRDGAVRKLPKGADSAEPLGLAIDAGGRAWYTEAPQQRISRVATDGTIASFPLATPVARLGRLAIAPAGDVWFAETSLVSLTQLKDGQLTRHVLGSFSPGTPMDAAPFGVAIARDGTVWATMQSVNKLLRLAPDGNKTAYEVPTRASGLGDVAVAADGAVWFLELAANKIGRFAAGRFEEFSVPTPAAGLTGLAVAPDGSVWFTELRGHRLGRIHTGAITEFVLPRADARPFGIAVDEANNVWYTDISGWLGRLDAEQARVR
jgi:virginiamycin B lyase